MASITSIFLSELEGGKRNLVLLGETRGETERETELINYLSNSNFLPPKPNFDVRYQILPGSCILSSSVSSYRDAGFVLDGHWP